MFSSAWGIIPKETASKTRIFNPLRAGFLLPAI